MVKHGFNANLYVEGYMRKEATQKEDQYKIWMTDDELEELRRHAENHRDDIILQLGGYVGLRAFEIPQVQPQHVLSAEPLVGLKQSAVDSGVAP